jgi:hypothetical protein
VRRTLALAALLAAGAWSGAAAQPRTSCRADADCGKLGAGYRCVFQKTACAVHPESSTCVERFCARTPGAAVKDEDRACKRDSDCAVVVPEFQCMYCARPGDWMNGVVAAANKKRAKAYEPKPTAAQLRRCATAGPCAQTGTAVAVCLNGLCAVRYEAREPAN